MIDYGGQKTDLAIRRAEWRLSRVYNQAAREIDEKTKAWQERHEAKDKKLRQMVKDGKMSKADYQAWQRGQVFQGKQWEGRKEQIRQVLLNSDKAAVNVIKEGKLGVFASNANYIGYGLEHDSGLNTGFLLYDEATVSRLIKGDPKMLPMLPPEKAVLKDKAYTYYNKLIAGAITQGIIQGEDIGQIAHRIARTTGEKCYKSAVTNARTAYTGAQNAGRIEGMHQAQRLGIKMQKQWLATPDDRTRATHADLDGQVQNVDDPFDSELGNIDYPGDPNADPANVYNCRCSLLYVYPEYPSDMKASADDIEDMSLDEWEEAKQNEETQKNVDEYTVVNGVDITQTWERRPDKFDFEINDVIDAQGFDGNPRVVDGDEFDRAVQESGFIAQRSYSAPDQEILDAYREQLYKGEWYVDCSTGGAQYGQGMYCAADYTGTLTDGIKNEMEHYRGLGESRYNGGGVSYTETFTLSPDAKIVTWREINDIRNGNLDMSYRTKEIERIVASQGFTQDEATFVKYNLGTGVSWGEVDAAARRLTPERRNELVDKFYQIGEEATRRYNEEHDRRVERARICQEKYHDIGSLAAALGYDAINAENHGQSGSYTVILNRTKVIFRRPQ